MLNLAAIVSTFEEQSPFAIARLREIITAQGEALIATREGDNLHLLFKGQVNVAIDDVYNYMTVIVCNVSFAESEDAVMYSYTSIIRCKAFLTLREALSEHSQGLLDEYEQDLND